MHQRAPTGHGQREITQTGKQFQHAVAGFQRKCVQRLQDQLTVDGTVDLDEILGLEGQRDVIFRQPIAQWPSWRVQRFDAVQSARLQVNLHIKHLFQPSEFGSIRLGGHRQAANRQRSTVVAIGDFNLRNLGPNAQPPQGFR